jgi:penicillin-binding protein 2
MSRDHAWFASYFPAKSPEIAVVVLIEHGGSGPTIAAPLAMQIIRDYRRLAQARAAKDGRQAGPSATAVKASLPAKPHLNEANQPSPPNQPNQQERRPRE